MNYKVNYFLFVLSSVFILLIPRGFSESQKNVLFLSSYHQGYKWTDDEIRGAIEGVKKNGKEVNLHFEYMGTKFASDQNYFDQLRITYAHKFSKIRFDIIVAMDDDALVFLRQFRDSVFGKIPVVFCGINWIKKTTLEGLELYTGVNEDADIRQTLDFMLKAHPLTQKIYAVMDSTTTGRILHEKILEILPEYRSRVEIQLLEEMSMQDVLKTVENAQENSLILLTLFQRDKNGIFFEYNESPFLISKASKVPVYGLWDFNLGFGIVGGMLTSGYSQGLEAGGIAGRILEGEMTENIPVLMKSPNHFMFDYNELKRWNIARSVLPPKSIVINEPVTFYQQYRGLVWGVISGFSALTVIIILLFLNLRQRIRAEMDLRVSEMKYRSLVDNINLGVFRSTIGKDARFLQANPAMLKIFGYDSMEEFLNIRVPDLYASPEERRIFLEDIVQNSFVRNREIAMRRKDGALICALVNASIQYDEKGKMCWIDGIGEDITTQRKLEEQLRQSQKMEAIGTLAGGVAHDFNNILTAIIGYAEIVRMLMEKDSPLKVYIDDILSASDRATHLTHSLLAFSRKQNIILLSVDLNDIIRRLEKFLIRIIGEDIEFQTSLCDESLTVLADSGQIEQILMNIATNARDAMPKGGILSIKTEHLYLSDGIPGTLIPAGEYAVISISDTGKGMDENTKQRIFEPFFTTKEVGKGTGLGLSIVYGIIKQHNGEITVYSEPGKGTTFRIYLKIAVIEPGKAEENRINAPSMGTETILLAEDDVSVRMLFSNILEGYGYTVIEAADGEEAVVKFREYKDKIHLLLLDVVMPRKNGKEAFEEIKKIRENIPVIFSSGYTHDIILKKGLLEEESNLIMKPVSPNALLHKIRDILDSK